MPFAKWILTGGEDEQKLRDSCSNAWGVSYKSPRKKRSLVT